MDEWWPSDQASATRLYIRAQFEFDASMIQTGRPYTNRKWTDEFRSISGIDAWKLKRDHILNDLTADLIALACMRESALRRINDISLSGFAVTSPGQPSVRNAFH